jgi:hypothetical protein
MQLLGMVLVVHRLIKLNALIGEIQLHLIVHVNVEDNAVLHLPLPLKDLVVAVLEEMLVVHLLQITLVIA